MSALGHVIDHTTLELFNWTIPLPNVLGLQLTRFMVMEVVAAGLAVAVGLYMRGRARRSIAAEGRFYHFWEAILVFVRKEIAEPNIGHHDAKRFLPLLWTLFLFILFTNLLGMIPFAATATAQISVTGGLALCAFAAIHVSGMVKLGAVGYLRALVPPVPAALWPLMLVVELIGHAAKPFALCVRLMANMLAGHMVLFTLLGLLTQIGNIGLLSVVGPVTVLGVAALSLLELFVAFLQTYIFVFLTSIFIGMAVHPEH